MKTQKPEERVENRDAPLRTLTAAFQPPCLLPRRKLTMWTIPCMVRPALVKQEFGRADLLLALAPISHRPAYYLVWVDSRWLEDDTFVYDHLDDIYEAIEEEFGYHSQDDGAAYRWPEADFLDGSCWRKASADDVLTARQRRAIGRRIPHGMAEAA